jgi:hypothetical protein
LQAAIARDETVNPKINAIVHSMADQAGELAWLPAKMLTNQILLCMGFLSSSKTCSPM